MENSQRIRVRKYMKSSVPRLRWTPELHDHFVEAVQKLGGKHKATPKRIMQMMAVRGLKISHIKSHLQMYRSMKESMDSNGLIAIKNYQEKKPDCIMDCITLLPIREKIIDSKKNIPWKNFLIKTILDRSTASEITKRDGEIPRANIELPEANAINFWGLSNQQLSESTMDGPINLDLTMSSY
ncbi:hypothetical protein Pfo_022226 [Paulownia fortunei]|nr:hypothetical protein Pfo_022226 [Paulownia fortunei]